MTDPACMTPTELGLWQEANAIADPKRRLSTPCNDCPLAFALSMREVGRCNGIPRDGRRGRLPGDGRGQLRPVAA
jgi:hypothetical protein